jgi:hypothetical protein
MGKAAMPLPQDIRALDPRLVKIFISRLLIFILFLFLLMSVRFQVSVFGFQRTEARGQTTEGTW